jgi:beta-glucosidase-like glycosyl hydrolase
MVSYSSYQGARMTGSKKWITDVLKGELGFQGIVVSDWDAVSQLPGAWNDQVEAAINAGLDMVMLSHTSGAHTAADLANAMNALVNSAGISADRIRDAVRRILGVKCEMGLLDGDLSIDSSLTDAIGSDDHRTVARQAVRESQVLLKNDGLLPLSKTAKKIHVTGSGRPLIRPMLSSLPGCPGRRAMESSTCFSATTSRPASSASRGRRARRRFRSTTATRPRRYFRSASGSRTRSVWRVNRHRRSTHHPASFVPLR